MRTDDHAGALDCYRAAIAQRLFAIGREGGEPDPADLRATAMLHGMVGDLLRARGDMDSAVDAHRSALEVFKHLLESAPDNALWRYLLAQALDTLAAALADSGRTEEAAAVLEQCVEIASALEDAAPANRRYAELRDAAAGRLAELHGDPG